MTTAPVMTAPLPLAHRVGRGVLAAIALVALVAVATVTFAIGRATAPSSTVPTVGATSQATQAPVTPFVLSPSMIAHCHPAAC